MSTRTSTTTVTRTRKRARTIVPVAMCVAAIASLLVGGLAKNVVYFRTVSEAVESRAADGTDRLRIAGAVVPGSVSSGDDGIVFELTDGVASVRVHHRGDPPELFEDGAPVLSEGHWSGNEFTSDRIMIKHGSEYAPPEPLADDAEASP